MLTDRIIYYLFNHYGVPAFLQKPLRGLPSVALAKEMVNGRCVYEGYQRGWGLQFGNLRNEVLLDPLYRETQKLAKGCSIMRIERRMNLYLIIRYFLSALQSQNIIEFGAYLGGNAFFMAALLKKLHSNAKVYALDTFEGMPDTDGGLDLHRKGDFADTTYEKCKAKAKEYGLDNLFFVKGLIEDTAAEVYKMGAPFGLAHIDVDIYSAVKYSQDSVWSQMCPGGYVVYDDATTSSCIGATQAVEELINDRHAYSEQIWPHFVFRAYPNESTPNMLTQTTVANG
jgi:predicted O-methyltransferase YrrM